MEKKRRVKKLTLKDRRTIMNLYSNGEHSMAEIGRLFNVSRGRVSQIVNDNYNEREDILHGDKR